MSMYAGVDWGSGAHLVCVINQRGENLAHFEVEHTAAGLGELTQRLRKFARQPPLRIAIERPSGGLIDTLVEAGFAVVPIHPNVVKASRPVRSICPLEVQKFPDPSVSDLARPPSPTRAGPRGPIQCAVRKKFGRDACKPLNRIGREALRSRFQAAGSVWARSANALVFLMV